MKVTTTSYMAKPFYPTNIYPTAAPPPCQVEEQVKLHNTSMRTERARDDILSRTHQKRARKKLNRKLTRANTAKTQAEESLLMLEEALANQAKRLAVASIFQ